MHSRESHVRANKLDLQEANVSVSQFLRIRIFSLDAGSRMDGILALDMWDVWSKFQHTTNPKEFCNRRQTQGSSGKLLARVLHQVEKRSPECWKDVKSRSSDHKRNFFSMWSAVRCTFLKTTKLWSRWSSKDEVQWWDMCQEPKESRSIGCTTESLWTQNPNQICWHQKTNLLTCWRKEVLRVMNGAIFFVCLTSLMFYMFSRSHFRSNEKASTMSRSAQGKRTAVLWHISRAWISTLSQFLNGPRGCQKSNFDHPVFLRSL